MAKKNSKISLVITTINPEAEILKKNIDLFNKSSLPTYIILDRKVKEIYKNPFINFISPPENLYERLAEWDNYSRKNIGYIRSFKDKNEWTFETDDDNLILIEPLKILSCFDHVYPLIKDKNFPNLFESIYESDSNIWARGYILSEIEKNKNINLEKSNHIKVDHCSNPVIQFLVEGSPDIDAIIRLVMGHDISYAIRKDYSGFVLKNSYHPFNSQGTLWHRDFLHLAYLPATCTFRMTDIYRGYIAQNILYKHNKNLLFCPAILKQNRNQHSLYYDFKDEHASYLSMQKFLEIINSVELDNSTNMLHKSYDLLSNEGFFSKKKEMTLLESFLENFEG